MLKIFADTIRTATRSDALDPRDTRAHWPSEDRFTTRRNAALEAHRIGRLDV